MTEYTVVWTIDIDADSAVGAAREALRIQRDPESYATVFEISVTGEDEVCQIIDLDEQKLTTPCECTEDGAGLNPACPTCVEPT